MTSLERFYYRANARYFEHIATEGEIISEIKNEHIQIEPSFDEMTNDEFEKIPLFVNGQQYRPDTIVRFGGAVDKVGILMKKVRRCIENPFCNWEVSNCSIT